MKYENGCTLTDETVSKIGLRISEKEINAELAHDSRVFEYPDLENVFIMESDLYGNRMPVNSCFLVFDGQHGLIGKPIAIETLLKATVSDLKQIVESNIKG